MYRRVLSSRPQRPLISARPSTGRYYARPRHDGRPPVMKPKPVSPTVKDGVPCVPSALPVHPATGNPDWKLYFNSIKGWRDRWFIANQQTARDIVKAMNLDDGGPPKTIIEAYPGSGMVTCALSELPESVVKKIIVMEQPLHYGALLKGIEATDPRITYIPESGWRWETYNEIEEAGLFADVLKEPWDSKTPHPNLRFLASALPFEVQGESLFNQSLRAMADKGWIFKYGRVPITFVCQDYLADRAFAPPGNLLRCKLSVMAEACATMEEIIPRSYFLPPEKHFYPSARNAKATSHFAVVNFVPKIDQPFVAQGVDSWDFVLRGMFIQKTKPVKKVVGTLCPGSGNLLEYLVPKEGKPGALDLSTCARMMVIEEWKLLLEAWDRWPFKPDMSALFMPDSPP